MDDIAALKAEIMELEKQEQCLCSVRDELTRKQLDEMSVGLF